MERSIITTTALASPAVMHFTLVLPPSSRQLFGEEEQVLNLYLFLSTVPIMRTTYSGLPRLPHAPFLLFVLLPIFTTATPFCPSTFQPQQHFTYHPRPFTLHIHPLSTITTTSTTNPQHQPRGLTINLPHNTAAVVDDPTDLPVFEHYDNTLFLKKGRQRGVMNEKGGVEFVAVGSSSGVGGREEGNELHTAEMEKVRIAVWNRGYCGEDGDEELLERMVLVLDGEEEGLKRWCVKDAKLWIVGLQGELRGFFWGDELGSD